MVVMGALATSAAAAQPLDRVEIECADAAALVAAVESSVAHRQAGSEVHLKLRGRVELDGPLVIPRLQQSTGAAHPRLVLRGPAVFDGGVRVTDWTRDAKRPWMYIAPLPSALRALNESITQLWDGDRRVPPARTPILHYTGVGEVNTTTGLAGSLVLNSSDGIPRGFAALSAVRLFLYHAWDISYHQLAEIRPVAGTASGLELVVANKIKTLWGVGAGAPGYRYFLEGAEEFLHEGSATFVHDAAAKQLLYAPADGAAPGAIVVPRLTELLRTDGATDVTLQDITFQHSAVDFSECFNPSSFCEMQSAADQSVAAVHFTNSERVKLTNVSIRHTGGYGLWFDNGCRDVVASRVHLHDLGAGGVRMTAAHNITLVDSVVEDGGHVWRQGVGILMQTANMSHVTHNSVSRFFYTGTLLASRHIWTISLTLHALFLLKCLTGVGISVGWTWGFGPNVNGGSVISANKIHTIGQGELSDLGCIYHLGRDAGTLM